MEKEFKLICQMEEDNKSKKIKKSDLDCIEEKNKMFLNTLLTFTLSLVFFAFYLYQICNIDSGVLRFWSSYIITSLWAFVLYNASFLEEKFQLYIYDSNNKTKLTEHYLSIVLFPLILPYFLFFIMGGLAWLLELFFSINFHEVFNVLYFCVIGLFIFSSIFYFVGFHKKFSTNKIFDMKNSEKQAYNDIKKRIKEHASDIETLECYIELAKKNKNENLTITLSNILSEQIKDKGFEDLYDYKKSLIKSNKQTLFSK